MQKRKQTPQPPERYAWASMKGRCTNPNHPNYRYYGGRGIVVCDRWMHSFRAFLADMGPRPSKDHSLDRIDNDGPYSPENCRWATRKTQQRNSGRAGRIEYQGRIVSYIELAEILQMRWGTIYQRIRAGWSIEEIIAKPIPCKGPIETPRSKKRIKPQPS
jgi:hypothetical protein